MLKHIFEYLISPRIKSNAIAYDNAKNIVVTMLVTVVAAPIYAYYYYFIQYYVAAYAVLIEGGIICFATILLRYVSFITVSRTLIIGSLIICITFLSYLFGGIISPPVFWLILPPIMSIYFGEVTSSFLWSACCVLITISLYLLQLGHIPFLYSVNEKILFLQMIALCGLIIVAHILSFFFERMKHEAIKEANLANLELQASKDKEEELTKIIKSNALLQNILDSSIEYSIIATDLKGTILTWNAGAERNYGYTSREVVGKNIHILSTEPELTPSLQKKEMIIKRIRKNNEFFYASVIVDTRRDKWGTPIGYLIISRDISPEIALQEKLYEKNTELTKTTILLNNILESSIDYSIIALDLTGIILTWNVGARREYGYEASDVVGAHIQKLEPSNGTQPYSYKQFFQMAQRYGKAEGIFQRMRKNGERYYASINVYLRKDSAGEPIGYLLISRDITEKLMLEEQIKRNEELDKLNRSIYEANQLKDAFLANMSHELRTPLHAILGFSQIIRGEVLGPITLEQQQAMDDIISSGKDLLRLIDSILDLTVIASGKLKFSPHQVNLREVVNATASVFKLELAKKNLHLTAHVDANVPVVFIDPERLKQVLYNYLSNAIKFTSKNGHIKLRIRLEGNNYFRIEVEDTGIGIKPEEISKLFMRFQQLDSSITKKYAGTGLGLSIVKQIVEAQGGQVGVTSKFGVGSIFYAILPCCYTPENIGMNVYE